MNQPGEQGQRLLDASSLRTYHEIQLLKVEIEIETATLLRTTGELVCALSDAAEALAPATAGKPIAADPESVQARRSRIEWSMSDAERWPSKGGSASSQG